LPTPFRALATDLETGEAVVLRSGDLATVLRASMSAPGVLAPVEIGGRLLVDGGLVDNLPVRLAREMNVDVLIVVDVSFPLAQRGDLQSPLDVTNQMIAIMVRRGTTNSRALLRAQDVLIEPDLGGMTSLEFERVPTVMATGETTTLAERRKLESLSLDEDDWQRYLAARSLPPQSPQTPAFVRAGERSQADTARIAAVFGDLAQKPLDPHKLQRRANREYGLDRYEAVDYRLVRAGEAEGVELDLREVGVDVGRQVVGRVADFIHELLGNGLGRHRAAGAGRFGDCDSPVFRQFGDRIPEVLENERLVPA
jgi:NTE family protein